MERFLKRSRPNSYLNYLGSSSGSSTTSNPRMAGNSSEAIKLTAALDCTRFLLKQGIAFRGDDEIETSSNKGNYVELMRLLADHDEKVGGVVSENAEGNPKYIAPKIQKDIVNACAVETINAITNDMDGAFFSLLIDESRDVSVRDQMAVVVRYVNKSGKVIERFLGVEHVFETTSIILKEAIIKLMLKTKLNMENLRGQSYDGASNMRGELNGLTKIIMDDYPQAYYVHCFAHQLQPSLVAVAKANENIATFFTICNSLVSTIGSLCKRRDAFREAQQETIKRALQIDDLQASRGLNRETTLKRPCDTGWNCHYDNLISIICMFDAVVSVLEWIVDDDNSDNRGEANRLLNEILTFDFVFHLFFMRLLLGITNDLSKALQKKDQDIVTEMRLVGVCKQKLQTMMDEDFTKLLETVSVFCEKHEIGVPNMYDLFRKGGLRRRTQRPSNLHHYRVDLFFHLIGMQLRELNNRFNEVNTEMLLCMTCLSPEKKFAYFDKNKIMKFATFYPGDFKDRDILMLEDQLGIYIIDMQTSNEFSSLKTISELAEKLVSTGRSRVYNYVYLLITLALVLPVATASVERTFSTMDIVKTPVPNEMGNQCLSDSLVVYIERDIFASISNDLIMRRFYAMKPRRERLL